MTLVDPTNGVPVEIADEQEATRLAAEISSAIAHMNARTGAAIEAMVTGYKARIWIALGLGSWEELVDERNWKWKPLTSEDRAAFGEVFRSNGMSFRSIGRLMGADDRTIRRDLAGAANAAPAEVQGADGKTYSATKPERPEIAEDHSVNTADVEPPVTEVGAASSPAPTSATSASPTVEGVAGDPPAPVAPSVDDFRDDDAEWQADFRTRLSSVVRLLAYTSETVRERATVGQIQDAVDLGKRIAAWANELDEHPTLQVINGGKQ